jgi:hypothetical protein
MYYAIIENNIVSDIIVADPAFMEEYFSDKVYASYVYDSEDDTKVAKIGEGYIKGKFVNGSQAVELGLLTVEEAINFGFHSGQEYTAPTKIEEVSMKQARLYLYRAGLLAAAEALIATDKEAEIAWEYSNVVNRKDHLVTAMATNLGLSEENLDIMFQEASLL